MSLYVSGTDMLSEDEYEVMQKAGTPHGAWPPTVTRDDEEEQVAQAGVMSSTFNLINTIIGGGVLSLPYAFSVSGYVMGTFLVIIVGILSCCSAHLLLSCIEEESLERSYRNVGYRCWGALGSYVVDISMCVFLAGILVGYLVIIESALDAFLGEYLGDWICATLVVAIIFPLSLIPRIKYLSWISLLSIALVVYGIVIIMGVYVEGVETALDDDDSPYHTSDLNDVNAFSSGWGVFEAIPIITVCFLFHMSLFPIYDEMKDRTPLKMMTTVYSSVAFSSAAYVATGLFGYLTFGSATTGNILNNYDGGAWISGGKIVLAAMLTLTCPLLAFPLRLSLGNLLFSKFSGRPSDWVEEPKMAVDRTPPLDKSSSKSSSWDRSSSRDTLVEGESGQRESIIVYGSIAVQYAALYQLDRVNWLGKLFPPDTWRRHISLAILIWLPITIAGTFFDRLQVILSYIGSTSAALIVYMLPSMFYLSRSDKSWFHPSSLFAIALALFGFFGCGVIGIVVTTVAVIRD